MAKPSMHQMNYGFVNDFITAVPHGFDCELFDHVLDCPLRLMRNSEPSHATAFIMDAHILGLMRWGKDHVENVRFLY